MSLASYAMSTASRDDAPPQPASDEAPPAAVAPKVIKRYSNRKLYDTDRSKYVTLDEIAKMIKAGEEVTIIDNESKEDLTSVTLTQIIYEEEKRESRMPLGMLRNLIQTGGTTLQDIFDRSVKAPVEQAQKSVEKSVEDLRQSAVNFREQAKRMLRVEERKAEEFKKALVVLLDHLDERMTDRVEELGASLRTIEEAASKQPEDQRESYTEQARAPLAIAEHTEMLKERLGALNAQVESLESLLHTTPAAPEPVAEEATSASDEASAE